MSPPHQIRRQSLQVKLLGNEQQGMQLQARLSAYCRDWLNPALERLFEQMAPGAEHIHIDRLSLDLGTLAMADWEQHLTTAVVEQLRSRLQVIAAEQSIVGDDRQTRSDTSVVRLQPPQQLFEAWLQFLQTGMLPWSFRLQPGHSLQSRIAALLSDPASMTAYRQQRLHQTLRQPMALQRLHQQFDLESRGLLLQRLAPELATTLLQTAGELKSSSTAWLHAKDQRHPQRGQTFSAEKGLQAVWQDNSLLEQLFKLWTAHALNAGIDWRRLLTAVMRDSDSNLVSLPATEAPFTGSQPRLPCEHSDQVSGSQVVEFSSNSVTTDGTEIRGGQSDDQAASPAASPSASVQPNPRNDGFSRFDSTISTEVLSDGIYLDNAGLVLLHPFLPQLFTALAIASDQNIVQPQRGLQLLHYLATGQTTAPEYQLPLAKLLLNYPLEQTVATLQPLTAGDQEEADALLKAVIRHWSALGDTSPDGLRGTFLLRPGKLSRREDGDWRLQVENQGFDILLNQLPWGFAMIRLPWMPNWLWVEWSY